ncbi:phosphoribosyl 1,2-cyclic phosphate phosphodiesterase [Lishizhenia tianjinensis]|uniref:Phosphoribosyl 1,2-cyclic phosphate phosphodiesterase n=1 Tax=Lishizhenia tianjinensis TaxID=477690 RepID=A0A1I6XVN9_9FLAO|nr:MBL fold metallo-hydrolase [Lishizhenia tianjinensis]SFT42585.1 phosphoribosyl 1,2-cyclic phosphate phosphodiesterase [Lishizhenia tianjinensis]
MKIVVLGSGTSQGVPVIACNCEVCLSEDPKDNRLRTSVMFTVNGENYVIDSGPDFRQQMLREKVQSLRALIFTHEHKDHVAGMDDVRAFNFKEKRDMEVFASTQVQEALHREFHYIFGGNTYPGIPKVNLNTITNEKFLLPCGEEITPIQVLHYKMPVLGFRIRNFSYVTDAKTIADEEIEKLKGSEVLIVNALRREEHISHFTKDEALELIAKVKPKKAYLTHISHMFGTQEEIENELPENVFVAYDGLEINI